MRGLAMRYETLSSPEIDALDRERTLMMLPLGAVEQHGRHMPVGTDSAIAHALCVAVAERGAARVVLPPPWYGLSQHHMQFPGSVTLRAETMMAMVGDVVDSLIAHGFRRILLVNGHGGNGGVLDVLSSTLGHRHYRAARIVGLTYFQLAADEIDAIRDSGPGGTGHAGEFETSVMLHLHPDQVNVDERVACYPDPGSPYLSTDLTRGARVRTYRDFRDLSEAGVLGDPALASAEKGRRFFDACADVLDAFATDFARWPVHPG